MTRLNTLFLLPLLVLTALLTTSILVQQTALGDDPLPTLPPGPQGWSVAAGKTKTLVSNAGNAADYEIINNGPSNVIVIVTDSEGKVVSQENLSSQEGNNSIHVGVQPGQNLKVKDGSSSGGASGTYERL